ncbi:MAG: acyl-phosphate glycerol 3-phosphate acyltransferase [Aliifodinibius sp.]|nr:acyl-phosphate glycerol 3-phosphate acyltransferase [Fodinibius sp.]
MENWLFAIGLCLLGYFSGSIPFSILITRLVKKVDVRDAGSGHATTTNTIRQAGWLAGALVLVFDMAKGYLPTLLALNYAPFDWVPPVVAGLAVVGHCWPIFAGFRGGMGLATAGASVLAVDVIYGLVGLGLLIILTLVIRHSARAAFWVGVLLAPMYYLLGERGMLIWVSAAIGLVVAIRFTSDWNRRYRELWLDRES